MFISFEGIDGSGKTTQARLLHQRLGSDAALVREPGSTALSERIREVLSDPDLPLGPFPEFLLFLAARTQLVDDVIRPALESGRSVVTDRYSDSSVAYQGAGRQLGINRVRDICDAATRGLWPDLTFLLWIDPEVAGKRTRRRDRFELEGRRFQETVADAYESIASKDPERVRTIDANGSVDAVHERVMAEFQQVVSEPEKPRRRRLRPLRRRRLRRIA